TGGVPELLNEGAGLLVPPQHGFALANAIDRLLNDTALKEQIAGAGRRRVEDEFAIEKIVSELAAHFERGGIKSSQEPDLENSCISAITLHDRQSLWSLYKGNRCIYPT